MCGRYGLITDNINLQSRYSSQNTFDFSSKYNIAPGTKAPVVLQEKKRILRLMQWGLIPRWAKDPSIGYKMINARSETAAEKPSFRDSFISRRCLVPSSGFYEWKKDGKIKIPYYIHLSDQDIFSFAGLYDTWTDNSGRSIETYSILTTEPNEKLKVVHNRMPVILKKDSEQIWLNTQVSSEAKSLLQTFPAERMEMYPVSDEVNSPKNNYPGVIKKVPVTKQDQLF